MDSSTNQLPPEILSLVFSELEGNKASLCSCSLTCKSWHALSLAHIYRNLIVSNDLMYLRFYRQLMIDAPHLCCHVRRIDISGFGAPGTLDSFSLEWCDDDHIQTFLQAFPRLNNLKCSSLLYNVIPHVLPHMPITALHIQSSLSYDVHWLFRILRAGGATIKTLKLEDIDFRVKLSRQATPSGGKILMSALQELSLIDCCNIPFRRSTVDMPNLKTFVCESYGYPDYHSILPTSLTTLVVEPLLEECDRTQTIVDNLCLLCLLEEDIDWIEATIDSVSVPTKIVHLEICLPEMSPSHPLVNPSNDLEVLVLRLYRDGSLKKLTVTVEQLTDPDILTRRFKELLRLGILEVRVEKQPLLHPSPYTFHIN